VEVARRIDLRVAVDRHRSGRTDLAGGRRGRRDRRDPDRSRYRHGTMRVKPGKPVLELARAVSSLDGLRLDGLQAYEGHAVYVNDLARAYPTGPRGVRRRPLKRAASGTARNPRRAFSVAARRPPTAITGSIDGVDEIQAGSYATMDWRYADDASRFRGGPERSRPSDQQAAGVAVLDVGLKGAGCEFGSPRIKDHPMVKIPFRVGRALHRPQRPFLEDRQGR
jgi:hypothetical protein